MIKILEDREQKFLDFLNAQYGTEQDCILSVFNCQDSVGFCDEEGKVQEAQSCFISEADLILLATSNPPEMVDCKGNPLSKWYEDNYTLLKLAHEYGHFLQKYGKLSSPEDLEEVEKVANRFAHKMVEEFIEYEK